LRNQSSETRRASLALGVNAGVFIVELQSECRPEGGRAVNRRSEVRGEGSHVGPERGCRVSEIRITAHARKASAIVI